MSCTQPERNKVLKILKEYRKDFSKYDIVSMQIATNHALREIVDLLFLGQKENWTILEVLDQLIDLLEISDQAMTPEEVMDISWDVAINRNRLENESGWGHIVNTMAIDILKERLILCEGLLDRSRPLQKRG